MSSGALSPRADQVCGRPRSPRAVNGGGMSMKPVSLAPFEVRSLPAERSGFEGALERLLESSGVGRQGFAVPRPVLAVPLRAPLDARDPLTKLANRASFLARLARSTAPEWCVEGLFVLLLDVDGFRGLNERFGYEAA